MATRRLHNIKPEKTGSWRSLTNGQRKGNGLLLPSNICCSYTHLATAYEDDMFPFFLRSSTILWVVQPSGAATILPLYSPTIVPVLLVYQWLD